MMVEGLFLWRATGVDQSAAQLRGRFRSEPLEPAEYDICSV